MRDRIKAWAKALTGFDPTYELFREWYHEIEKRSADDLGNVTLENYMIRTLYDGHEKRVIALENALRRIENEAREVIVRLKVDSPNHQALTRIIDDAKRRLYSNP